MAYDACRIVRKPILISSHCSAVGLGPWSSLVTIVSGSPSFFQEEGGDYEVGVELATAAGGLSLCTWDACFKRLAMQRQFLLWFLELRPVFNSLTPDFTCSNSAQELHDVDVVCLLLHSLGSTISNNYASHLHLFYFCYVRRSSLELWLASRLC